MGLSVVNEKELGESIASSVAPHLVAAQNRLERWAADFITRLLEGHAIKIKVPLGEKVVEATLELIPK